MVEKREWTDYSHLRNVILIVVIVIKIILFIYFPFKISTGKPINTSYTKRKCNISIQQLIESLYTTLGFSVSWDSLFPSVIYLLCLKQLSTKLAILTYIIYLQIIIHE